MEIAHTGPSWARRLVVAAVVAVAFRALVVITFRAASPAAFDRVRRFNKRVLNPLMLRLAGRSHWYAGCLEHVGRRSGRTYRTPVVALPVLDGFVVPLPYGTHVDWLLNLLAAGTGSLKVKGVQYTVRQPRVLVADKLSGELPPMWRAVSRLYGSQHFLRVVATPVATSLGAPSDARTAAAATDPIDASA
jgi:deazaflavin-dependent oxidoreductase (nitroreductase family)